eukprot:TRINITY_DN3778_c0_g1_i13.p1 TRINITY_DN3778_c0_g1~~TRINITY_DN3778_c0_g1_i13.p1  ORF type:complete len:120 (+),score=4.44 TRINITY_DN3778_c0_g1_i13:299-658(+)
MKRTSYIIGFACNGASKITRRWCSLACCQQKRLLCAVHAQRMRTAIVKQPSKYDALQLSDRFQSSQAQLRSKTPASREVRDYDPTLIHAPPCQLVPKVDGHEFGHTTQTLAFGAERHCV